MKTTHRSPLAFLILFALGCSGLGAVVPIAVKLGKSLLEAATANYSPSYAEAIEELIAAMTKPAPEESSARPAGPPLAIEVAILREASEEGRTSLVPIEDGAVLRDGGADPESGDKFKISFRSGQRCHVYVLAIDGTGWVTSVFPGAESPFGNPVEPGRTYLIPDGARWYALDEHKGVEHVYLLASLERRPDIEELQADFARRVRPELAEYRRVAEAAVATRGIVAVGPGKATQVAGEDGRLHAVTPTSFLADVDGFDLVLTRWFVHE
jgi:hypothetical protein